MSERIDNKFFVLNASDLADILPGRFQRVGSTAMAFGCRCKPEADYTLRNT